MDPLSLDAPVHVSFCSGCALSFGPPKDSPVAYSYFCDRTSPTVRRRLKFPSRPLRCCRRLQLTSTRIYPSAVISSPCRCFLNAVHSLCNHSRPRRDPPLPCFDSERGVAPQWNRFQTNSRNAPCNNSHEETSRKYGAYFRST